MAKLLHFFDICKFLRTFLFILHFLSSFHSERLFRSHFCGRCSPCELYVHSGGLYPPSFLGCLPSVLFLFCLLIGDAIPAHLHPAVYFSPLPRRAFVHYAGLSGACIFLQLNLHISFFLCNFAAQNQNNT